MRESINLVQGRPLHLPFLSATPRVPILFQLTRLCSASARILCMPLFPKLATYKHDIWPIQWRVSFILLREVDTTWLASSISGFSTSVGMLLSILYAYGRRRSEECHLRTLNLPHKDDS